VTPRLTISNASPIIALHQIGQLEILRQLYANLVVPTAVAREVAPSVSLPPWIMEQLLSQPIAARIVQAGMGPGESETISLALELNAHRVLVDDRPARRLAQALGLRVRGTIGVLVVAKRAGILSSIRPSLDALASFNFFSTSDLYDWAHE
jgi:predicted nucleic acid-binding protein